MCLFVSTYTCWIIVCLRLSNYIIFFKNEKKKKQSTTPGTLSGFGSPLKKSECPAVVSKQSASPATPK